MSHAAALGFSIADVKRKNLFSGNHPNFISTYFIFYLAYISEILHCVSFSLWVG
jgi:hypothetical protein